MALFLQRSYLGDARNWERHGAGFDLQRGGNEATVCRLSLPEALWPRSGVSPAGRVSPTFLVSLTDPVRARVVQVYCAA
jgi:hypothetical protein